MRNTYQLFKFMGLPLLLFFIAHSEILYAQSLESQVEAWNEENQFNITISKIHSYIDWGSSTLISNIQLSWPYDADPYTMPKRALKHIDTVYPGVLSYNMRSLPAVNLDSLLQLAQILDMSSELFTRLLKYSVMRQYVPARNMFSLNIIFSTELSPILYETLFPQYNTMELPRILSIDYKTTRQYSSIIFSTETHIPLVTDSAVSVEFTPKLLPKVYGSNGQVIYTPEYYNRESEARAYSYFFIENIHETELGLDPYIVIPAAINAEKWGDIIISEMDTKTILSNNSLRKLIKEGRVFFALAQKKYTILTLDASK